MASEYGVTALHACFKTQAFPLLFVLRSRLTLLLVSVSRSPWVKERCLRLHLCFLVSFPAILSLPSSSLVSSVDALRRSSIVVWISCDETCLDAPEPGHVLILNDEIMGAESGFAVFSLRMTSQR